MGAGAVLMPAVLWKTANAMSEPAPTRGEVLDPSHFIPESLKEQFRLRSVVLESQELLAQHPALFYPVSSTIPLPERAITQLDQTQFELIQHQYVAPVAVVPLTQLLSAAEQGDYSPRVLSGYRSYDFQAEKFAEYVDEEMGELRKREENADKTEETLRLLAEKIVERYSARPGYSEHNLGTAFDIVSDANHDFVYARQNWNSGLYLWFRDHAHEYGFVISYPRGVGDDVAKRNAGYDSNEPWHLRFVGQPLASYLFEKQYLNPASPATLQTVLMQVRPFVKN